MFTISAVVANHIRRALLGEIDRLERTHQECGDDWPKGFDPNDIWMLRLMLPHFPVSAEGTITVPTPTSKPVQFTMALIPGYVSANKNLLSVAEVKALEAALADYQKVRYESNNRFERSRCRVFVGPRRESMIGIKCLRLTLPTPRVTQLHR
jgi:hypothetical protein